MRLSAFSPVVHSVRPKNVSFGNSAEVPVAPPALSEAEQDSAGYLQKGGVYYFAFPSASLSTKTPLTQAQQAELRRGFNQEGLVANQGMMTAFPGSGNPDPLSQLTLERNTELLASLNRLLADDVEAQPTMMGVLEKQVSLQLRVRDDAGAMASQQALIELMEKIAVRVQSPSHHLALASHKLGILQHRAGKGTEAVATFTHALDLLDKLPPSESVSDAYLELAQLPTETPALQALSLRALNTRLAQEPHYEVYKVLIARAKLYQKQGEHALALADFQSVMHLPQGVHRMMEQNDLLALVTGLSPYAKQFPNLDPAKAKPAP